ncbi:plasmid recombination protein [Faecalibacterium sp. An77]|nr:plasmid recombination protein [Faecalibacterium sp. An77]
MEQYQAKETIISAVVHMDEKTPHMHLPKGPKRENNLDV